MKWLIITVSILWYWHSYDYTTDLGYDFQIYYEAAKRNFTQGWAYPEWTSIFFSPLSVLPEREAHMVFYALTVLAWLGIAKRIHPVLGLCSFYPMLLALQVSQVTPVLAWLCFFPFGAVVASCIKPYCAVFIVLHVSRILKSQYVGGAVREG